MPLNETAQLTAVATFDTAGSGQIVGSATALVLPDIPCRLVRFKALAANSGNVYIGIAGVTVSTSATTTTTGGFELDAGDDTGWIPVQNLNIFYQICTDNTNDFTYLFLL